MPRSGEAAFDILVACPSGLAPSQLQIDFGSLYDRVPHADVELEGSIEEVWTERLQANSSLFNASKFRYGGFKLLSSKQSERDSVCLWLGLTDYKTFVGTNLSHNWQAFLKCSEDDIERCQHLASPLGNGAIVKTKDDDILVLKRSERVGEFPGHLVFPGGHSEPMEIGILGHNDSGCSGGLNTKISDEMYIGIVREIVEETGVPASTLVWDLSILNFCATRNAAGFFNIEEEKLSSWIQEMANGVCRGFLVPWQI